jgi:hypothetical protein
VRLEGQVKNSNDFIGNQTHDLPTCSTVPQPTTLPRAPWKTTMLCLTSLRAHLHHQTVTSLRNYPTVYRMILNYCRGFRLEPPCTMGNKLAMPKISLNTQGLLLRKAACSENDAPSRDKLTKLRLPETTWTFRPTIPTSTLPAIPVTANKRTLLGPSATSMRSNHPSFRRLSPFPSSGILISDASTLCTYTTALFSTVPAPLAEGISLNP